MTTDELIKSDLFKGKAVIMPKKSIELMLKSLIGGEEIMLVAVANSNNNPGVITLTDKRILFTSKVLFNSITRQFDLKTVTSIGLQSSYANKLTITSVNEIMVIDAIDKAAAETLIMKYNQSKQLITS